MITVVTGPMWASKSRKLIRFLSGAMRVSDDVLAFQSVENTRDSIITSRDGAVFPSIKLTDEELLKRDYRPYSVKSVRGVDEVHLFDKDALLKYAEQFRGPHLGWLILSGLTFDSEDRPMGALQEIRSWDLVDTFELTAICELCGDVATETFCRIVKTKQMLVGDSPFGARCKPCKRFGDALKLDRYHEESWTKANE